MRFKIKEFQEIKVGNQTVFFVKGMVFLQGCVFFVDLGACGTRVIKLSPSTGTIGNKSVQYKMDSST